MPSRVSEKREENKENIENCISPTEGREEEREEK